MLNVVYAPEADDDIIGIADFIARDKPEAARHYFIEMHQAGVCDIR